MLFWILVETVTSVFSASIPLNSLPRPLSVVVPVPLEAPKPITLPVTVNEPPTTRCGVEEVQRNAGVADHRTREDSRSRLIEAVIRDRPGRVVNVGR